MSSMDPQEVSAVVGACALAIFTAYSSWRAKTAATNAESNTVPVSNGFAQHVRDQLASLTTSLTAATESLLSVRNHVTSIDGQVATHAARVERLEGRLDRLYELTPPAPTVAVPAQPTPRERASTVVEPE